MAQYVQVDVCPVCSSPVYIQLVGPKSELPPLTYSCRCRQVHPERFTTPGEHGYKRGRLGVPRR